MINSFIQLLLKHNTDMSREFPNVLEYRFFHRTPSDDKFYFIIYKMILPDTIISDDNDHHFFYQCFETNYYVTCKLYPSSLIISILNKELYGIDIDLNNLNDLIG